MSDMRHYLRLLSMGCALFPASLLAGLRVDLSIDNGRHDVLSHHVTNWVVPDGSSASQTFDKIKVTISGDVEALKGEWWKAGLDYDAMLASDGIATSKGEIQIELSGLSPGDHSITTLHNALGAQPMGELEVWIDEAHKVTVQPSYRVTSDDDVASAHVEFSVKDNQPVVVHIRAKDNGSTVLNGFEIDTTNPLTRAAQPVPPDQDEHAPEKTSLSWRTARGATHYQVYVGTSREAVEKATVDSPEFRGLVEKSTYQPSDLSHMNTYFWRVDGVDNQGQSLGNGVTWRFRTRHLAFPGAEGYGRFARGGRGGKVYEVTNLNDSGPGSLREAVEADGPRTVVFRVGGTIELESKLIIRNPYITIAGQTAPGDGITVGNYTLGALGARDVIMRYMRIRVGDKSGGTMDGTGFASTDHAIYDHCSISWSQDEAVSSRGAGNITLQRCLVAEALNVAGHRKYGAGKGHSFAGSISGNIGSFHHNLLAHCAGRNWSLAGGLSKGAKFAGYLDIRNNVVYNWMHRTNDGGVKALNLVGNFYIPGPATRVFHLLKPDVGTPEDRQMYYMADNRMEGRPQYDKDNWANGGSIIKAELMKDVRVDQPLFESFVTTQSAMDAYKSIINDVGANLPHSDPIDRQVIQDVINRSFTYRGSVTDLPGIIDSQKDVGGFPTMRNGEAPLDSDHDGMPDSWENKKGLNPHDPEDRNQLTPDGYTQLEAYLNWIVENSGLPKE